MQIIGHRGWPARFPDNTLAGFLAVSDIADGVELDVRRSSDGKLVLAHDPVIAGFEVASTPWSELAELDLGEGHHPALLDEVLGALPDTPAQIEIKNYPWEKGFEPDHRLALEAAERARPADTITSFNHLAIGAVRRVFPDMRTGLAIEVFADLEDSVKFCFDEGHMALVPAVELITGPIDFELEVYPWTVNSPVEAEKLAQLGVSGIITDDAASISDAIKDHS